MLPDNPIDLTLPSPVHHDLQPRYHIGGPISREDVSALKHSRFDPSTIPSNTHGNSPSLFTSYSVLTHSGSNQDQ